MKTLIILNGEYNSSEFLKGLSKKADYIICADGGYENATKAEVTPDLVLGDFDSSLALNFKGERITFPADKDKTDGELAIEEAFARGADEIILTCALGGRCDHLLGNLYLLKKYNNVCILEQNQSIYYVNDKFYLQNKLNATVSLIPICNSVVSVKGFKYKAENTEFSHGSTLGMSNVVCDLNAKIEVKTGELFLIINE